MAGTEELTGVLPLGVVVVDTVVEVVEVVGGGGGVMAPLEVVLGRDVVAGNELLDGNVIEVTGTVRDVTGTVREVRITCCGAAAWDIGAA